MSCVFHAHTADTPCPFCAEAQGRPLAPYVGMRTKQCALICEKECLSVEDVRLRFRRGGDDVTTASQYLQKPHDLDAFAVADGFDDWPDLCAFWKETHDAVARFEGVLIRWAP